LRKILLVTSRKLEEAVKEALEPPEGYQVEVWGLPVDVVALLRPKSLLELIKSEAARRGTDVKSFDYIIVSGMVPGDMRELGEALGVPVYKGTKTLADLKTMISNISELESALSPVEPLEEALEELRLIEIAKELDFEYEEVLSVGSLKLPLRAPPSFLAAEVLDNESLEEQLHRASEVADMVIIGSTSTTADPSKIARLVKLAYRYFDTVGIDSMFVSELKAADADLYMSLERSKIDHFKNEKEKAFVVTPGDLGRGHWPTSAEEKVSSLLTNINEAEKRGIEKLIADPVLSPFPYALESIVALRETSKKIKKPLMFGLSNFVELADFDSPGQVGALASLAVEAGASLVMVTEHSDKCRGAWAEAKVSLLMASVAKKRRTHPKDLGLDLLILKEKKIRRERPEVDGYKLEAKDYNFPLEKTIVRIWVDGKAVKAYVRPHGALIEGDPYLIGKTLIGEGFVKEPSHALYLGWELHKAHLAAKLGKSYVQEEPLSFETPREKLEKLNSVRREREQA